MALAETLYITEDHIFQLEIGQHTRLISFVN